MRQLILYNNVSNGFIEGNLIISTITNLQKQIKQSEAKISELREKLTQQTNIERVQVIASVKELIRTH